jgi:hypothetical protein
MELTGCNYINMKKSILILFVVMSQVCMGQYNNVSMLEVITMDGNGAVYINGKRVPTYLDLLSSYQKSDSIIISLKNRLDTQDSLYIDCINKLMKAMENCNCNKKKLKK